ncbi:MAG: cellulose-binding protein, partial [Cyanobacteria bacterium P01_A01_bin.135]
MTSSTRLTVCLGFVAALLLTVGLQYLRPQPTASPPQPTASALQPATEIGTNLAGIADWSTQMPFVDGFKSSRPWITQCAADEPDCQSDWSTEEEDQLDLDGRGWVRSLPTPDAPPEYTRVGTLLFRGVEEYPSGEYIVRYEGQGQLRYDFDAELRRASPGEDRLQVTPSDAGILLQITATDPNDYIRN